MNMIEYLNSLVSQMSQMSPVFPVFPVFPVSFRGQDMFIFTQAEPAGLLKNTKCGGLGSTMTQAMSKEATRSPFLFPGQGRCTNLDQKVIQIVIQIVKLSVFYMHFFLFPLRKSLVYQQPRTAQVPPCSCVVQVPCVLHQRPRRCHCRGH